MLASHAAAMRLPIASTTKLMTAYVALQELPLDKIVRAAPYDPIYGESLLNLRAGQRISVRDLLYGLILRSGNDAAYDLARAAAGSEAAFVRQMNLRAAALGLADTHYANPIGLDEARQLLERRRPGDAGRAPAPRSRPSPGSPPRGSAACAASTRRGGSTTINELLHLAPWVTGVKTGHTFDAGYVLVGSGRRKGVELISVVIGAPDPGSARRRQPRAARVRLRPVPAAGADPRRARTSPTPRSATPAASCRCGRRAPSPPACAAASASSVDVEAPAEVEGPIERGAALGRATVARRRPAGGLDAAARRARDPGGERSSTGSAASSRTHDSHRGGPVRDTDWQQPSCGAPSGAGGHGEMREIDVRRFAAQ